MTLHDQCVEAAAKAIHPMYWPTDVGWDESTESHGDTGETHGTDLSGPGHPEPEKNAIQDV